jgi:hypothetical protein
MAYAPPASRPQTGGITPQAVFLIHPVTCPCHRPSGPVGCLAARSGSLKLLFFRYYLACIPATTNNRSTKSASGEAWAQQLYKRAAQPVSVNSRSLALKRSTRGALAKVANSCHPTRSFRVREPTEASERFGTRMHCGLCKAARHGVLGKLAIQPLIGGCDPVLERDARLPAECGKSAQIEKLAWRTIGT